MDWSIQGIARLTVCTTSRTLRHYDCIGLLAPSRVGGNGYRSYDENALARLQRILLLRVLGLGLPSIAEVLAGQRDNSDALLTHLHWLLREKERLDRQIAAVETTITNSEGREQLMAEEMFDGFDHTRYKEEVEERWGKNAYGSGDRWWRRMSAEEKAAWYKRSQQLSGDWIAAAESRGRESQRSGQWRGTEARPAPVRLVSRNSGRTGPWLDRPDKGLHRRLRRNVCGGPAGCPGECARMGLLRLRERVQMSRVGADA